MYHLSDADSHTIFVEKILKVEDPVEVYDQTHKYLAQIIEISKDNAVIQVKKEIEKLPDSNITLINIYQAASNDTKFTFFLEKITEIGINSIYPMITEYNILSENDAVKKNSLWKKVISDATEQSRNPYPPTLHNVTNIQKAINTINKNDLNICLTTENTKYINLKKLLNGKEFKVINIFIGPEKGWSLDEIKLMEQSKFRFIRLQGNILRTETAGLVITSIIKFVYNVL
jgi:16S rRNA (uracil1498-N3)-methyltransferase